MEAEAGDELGSRDARQPPEESRRAAVRAKKLKPLQLLTICVAQLNEAIQITMPYTVAVYMVRDFESRRQDGAAANEKTVGSRTGILAACFCAAQFLSSFPWGRISDVVGRKPMLVMSNFSSCISVIGFGLSDSFLMAALLRSAGGLFNCTFVCLKSMIGESCDVASQARPLSILSLCWGLGTVIGPSLGGVLSRPCDTFGTRFPFCGPDQFLQARPFFLPCGVVGMISFLALLSSLFFMEETLPRKVSQRYSAIAVDDELYDETNSRAGHLQETELARLAEKNLLSPESHSSPEDEEQALEVHVPEDRPSAISFGDDEDMQKPNGHWDKRVGEGQERGEFLQRNDTASLLGGGVGLKKLQAAAELDEEKAGLLKKHLQPQQSLTPRGLMAPECDPLPEQILASQIHKAAEEEMGTVWYKDKQVLLTVTGYAMICLLYNLMDEITPIYGSAARGNGGLGLTTSQIALPLALSGVAIFVWSMFFYPWLQHLLGVINTCRLGMVFTVPLCLGIALPSVLPVQTLALQLILAAVLCMKNIMATNSFTASVIMVNSVAPQKSIGAVNGASQAAASFVRAVGPALGGVMWGFSVSVPVGGHQFLPFAITAAGYAAPLAIFSLVRLPQTQGPGQEV